MTEDQAWLTAREAAAHLKTSRRNFDRLKIARHILGMRTPRFLKADLDAYMASRRIEPVTLAPFRTAPLLHSRTKYGRSKSAENWLRDNLKELKDLQRSSTATASSKSDGAK